MFYFIFIKNSDNLNGTIFRIAETQSDLDNLNIIKTDYKILQDTEENFNDVKFGKKFPLKYNESSISFVSQNTSFIDKKQLENYIENYKIFIKNFLESNSSHYLFNRWNDYLNQLNNLNLDLISYPLNKSLEQHFSDLGKPSLNILQTP